MKDYGRKVDMKNICSKLYGEEKEKRVWWEEWGEVNLI